MGGKDNKYYEPIIHRLQSVKTENSIKVDMKTLDMTKLFPRDLNEFYRYEGSLTTPKCNEVATWTVFKVCTIGSLLDNAPNYFSLIFRQTVNREKIMQKKNLFLKIIIFLSLIDDFYFSVKHLC